MNGEGDRATTCITSCCGTLTGDDEFVFVVNDNIELHPSWCFISVLQSVKCLHVNIRCLSLELVQCSLDGLHMATCDSSDLFNGPHVFAQFIIYQFVLDPVGGVLLEVVRVLIHRWRWVGSNGHHFFGIIGRGSQGFRLFQSVNRLGVGMQILANLLFLLWCGV